MDRYSFLDANSFRIGWIKALKTLLDLIEDYGDDFTIVDVCDHLDTMVDPKCIQIAIDEVTKNVKNIGRNG